MGTRADFYVCEIVDDMTEWEWMGSVAYDGYPEDGCLDPYEIMTSKSEKQFRQRVTRMFETEDHATIPDQGWPWPWTDSDTTDYAYVWDKDEDKLFLTCFGHGWRTVKEWKAHNKACKAAEAAWNAWNAEGRSGPEPKDEPPELFDEEKGSCGFPDMSDSQNVTLGGRSGLMVIS